MQRNLELDRNAVDRCWGKPFCLKAALVAEAFWPAVRTGTG